MMPPSAEPPLADRRLKDLRLLIVDDQPNALNLIRDLLTNIGLRWVVTAANGGDAIRIIEARGASLDAVLCDWTMPELNGLETLRRVRKMNPDLPFVMVTGSTDPSSVLAAKDMGVSGYLKKPFSREDLRKKLVAIARVKAFRADSGASDDELPSAPGPE